MSVAELVDERLVTRPSASERERGRRQWQQFMVGSLFERVEKVINDPEGGSDLDRAFARNDLKVLRKNLKNAKVLLVQVFEGALTDKDEDSAIVRFETDEGPEFRQFARADLQGPDVEEGTRVQLRCELVRVPPRPGLTEKEAEKWLQERSGREVIQKKARRAELLIEEDE